MVYVDYPVFAGANGLSCHMVADNKQELHAIAKKAKLHPSQFVESLTSSPPHYKLSKDQRLEVIDLGAIAAAEKVREISTKHRSITIT